MKKGIRAHDVKAFGLAEICKKCKENDIEYLQLVLEKSVDDFEIGKFSEEYAKSIKEQLGDKKIAILGSYINPSNPNEDELKKDIEKFKEKIRYATVLNPIAVGTETGRYCAEKTHTEEAYQYLIKNLKEIVCYAEKHNVTVAVEGVHCFVIDSPKMMYRLINDIKSPNLKLIFDPVNLINKKNYLEQKAIIDEAFDLFAEKIVAIHIKDFIVENNELKFAELGKGMFEFDYLMEKIEKYNIDVPFICEEFGEKEVKKFLDYLEKH